MLKVTQGIYKSKLFDFPSLIHGFSSKTFGDMRDAEKRKIFLSSLGLPESSLVQQEQVHKDNIHSVTLHDRGKIIPGVDGLVYKDEIASPNDQGVILSVHTADCVPIMAVDPVARVIGVVHAGWKGTTLHIGKKMVEAMVSLGSIVQDIRVVIGPHICGNCYEVDRTRSDIFESEFPSYSDIVFNRNGKLYVDIGKANWHDVISLGIQKEHIDTDTSGCTYEHCDELYSFRRSGRPLEGEMMGVIGFLRK